MKNNYIKAKRKELGLTQKEFSDLLNMGANGDRTLRRWENGESSPSSLEFNSIMNFEISEVKAETSNKFKYADLFSGIGGLRLPFQELGGTCVFSSEWDKYAQKSYYSNYGELPYGDITKIDEKEIPDFDVLLAGFPCQPFSQAGLGKGFSDTRGTLFFDIERIIREKRPKAFLLENVKRLKGHDKGKTFSTIIKSLENLGYVVSYEVLKARDFGLPQNRERIYIVGFNSEILKSKTNFEFNFPKPMNVETRLGSILEDEVDSKYTISDKLWEGHQRRKRQHKINGNGFGYSIFNAESPYTSTLSARYYKDGSEILIEQQDKNPRKLTPRECARLQGFSDEFKIVVSDTQAYKQFGNSVAVPVIRKISEQIIFNLKKEGVIENDEE